MLLFLDVIFVLTQTAAQFNLNNVSAAVVSSAMCYKINIQNFFEVATRRLYPIVRPAKVCPNFMLE